MYTFIVVLDHRLYNICIYIIIPLLAMIGLCFLFGFIVATFERSYEIKSNNDAMRDVHKSTQFVNSIIPSIKTIYEECQVQFEIKSSSLSTSSLVSFMDECTKDRIALQEKLVSEYIKGNLVPLHLEDFSYNWNIYQNQKTTSKLDQTWSLYFQWTESYLNLRKSYITNGMKEEEANEKALEEADGSSQNCVLNLYGAAMFWYTIMTTIGYGNASPVTLAGRIMVYLFGFFHIFVYGVIIANAGNIIMTIVDDLFCCRLGWKRLTKGIISVLLWFTFLVIWLFFLGFMSWILYGDKYDDDSLEDLLDGFWFAFISVTTVGFGDIFLPPEFMKLTSPFVFVFLISSGFIIYSIFWIKASKLFLRLLNSSQRELDDNMKSLRGELPVS